VNDARQKAFLSMGKEGCLFFSLVWQAEQQSGAYVDAYLSYLHFRTTRLLSGLPCIEENCYVNDIGAVFSALLSQRWTCEKRDVATQTASDELEITRVEKASSPTVTATHFVCTDRARNVVYDPIGADPSAYSMDGGDKTKWIPAKKYVLRRVA
jgi:hypothetical protein